MPRTSGTCKSRVGRRRGTVGRDDLVTPPLGAISTLIVGGDGGWPGKNIGSPKFDLIDGGGSTTLPARQRFGASYRWHPESIIGFDLQETADGKAVVNLGGEVWFYNALAVRVGANDRNAGGGVSVKSRKWQLDLSFLTNQPLGISYRAGLKVPF